MHQKVSTSFVCNIRSVQVHRGKSKSHNWIFNNVLAGIFKNLRLRESRWICKCSLIPSHTFNSNSKPGAPKLPKNLCSVCFLGFKIKTMQISFQNEQNLPIKRIYSLVSNSKMNHVISDKNAVTINSTLQNWAPSNWENLAKHNICNYAIFCIQHADWYL